MLKIQLCITGKYTLKYKTQNKLFKMVKNISHYYVLLYLDQINAALVEHKRLNQTHLKSSNPMRLNCSIKKIESNKKCELVENLR